MALESTAKPSTSSRRHAGRRLERVVGLQPGQLDDLLDQPAEPVGLGEHPLREPLDRLGVVRGVGHGLGQQPDGADRRLELVAHVGDEVAADLLDPALPGAVLDQGQHQPGAERRDPGGDVARRLAGPAHHQLDLADLSVAAYLRDDVAQLRVDQLGPADQPEGVRRRGRLDARGRSRRRRPSCCAAPTGRRPPRAGRRACSTVSATCCWRSLMCQASTAPPATTAPMIAARNAWNVGSTCSWYCLVRRRLDRRGRGFETFTRRSRPPPRLVMLAA